MITSVQNRRVKEWRKLHLRKEREHTQTFLIEGHHLIEEAIKSQWPVKHMIVQKGVEIPFATKEIEIVTVHPKVFRSLSQTESPQGMMAVVSMPGKQERKGNLILLVDQVQDPGNLGTLIRTADAAGFSTVVLGEGTVDVYNDKVLRATQGSLFHVHCIQENLYKKMDRLKEEGFHIIASALEDAIFYEQMRVSEKTALIVGNEGAGIQKKLIEKADQTVKIPIFGKAESLNVSIAAGILMYNVQRKLAL